MTVRNRDLNRRMHELANQLTVINLSCFKLRDLLSGKLDPDQLREFDTIESAISETAELLEQLSRHQKATSASTNKETPDSHRHRAVIRSNVYPISSRLKPRR